MRRHPVGTAALVVLALLILGAGITYFATNRGRDLLPTLEKLSFNVSGVNRETLQARMHVAVRNHTPLTLHIDSVSYQAGLNGRQVAQGHKSSPLVLRGNAISQLDLPLTLNLPQLKQKAETLQQDCVTVQMHTVLYATLPVLGPQRIPVDVHKRVYIPKLPTLEHPTLNISNVSREKIQAQLRVGVRNYASLTLRIDSMRYETRLDGTRLAQGHKSNPLVVKANATSQLVLPLAVDLPAVKHEIKTAQQDCVTVQVHTVLYAKLPGMGPQRIPLDVKTRVYIPKLPKIEVAGVNVTHLGLKSGEAVVNLRVINYEPIPFTLKQVSYRFQIENGLDVQGQETKNVTFHRRGNEIMPIHVHFQPKALPKTLFKTLFEAKKTDYKLTGTATVAAGSAGAKDATIQFNNSGTLKELKDMAKAGKKK